MSDHVQRIEPCLERFVPASASLTDDAPGWNMSSSGGIALLHNMSSLDVLRVTEDKDAGAKGPICWKCRGSGKKKVKAPLNRDKKKRNPTRDNGAPASSSTLSTTTFIDCTVCCGVGSLPPKQCEIRALNRPGEITRARACPVGWKLHGPPPDVLMRAARTADTEKLTDDRVSPAAKRSRNNQSELCLSSFNQMQALNLLRLTDESTNEVSVSLPPATTEQNDAAAPFDDKIITNGPFRAEADPIPTWLPRPGEQLCHLVGQWRILQRIGSHRWTTDDLVTSYLAGLVWKQEQQAQSTQQQPDASNHSCVRYLDLGCGNGSVLLMTTWQLISQQQHTQQQLRSRPPPSLELNNDAKNDPTRPPLLCFGIEARKEAVELARRTVAFNVGELNPHASVQILHGDFRELAPLLEKTLGSAAAEKFDLVTGTPPYFRVNFTVEQSQDRSIINNESTTDRRKKYKPPQPPVVTKAVIQQGGMPSCKQSAPARCEFRGGVEAYCAAAAAHMAESGVFCVCENWLNNERVYEGARLAGMAIVQVLPVRGKSGKPTPLFAVYVMRKLDFFARSNSIPPTQPLMQNCLDVRDDMGQWTMEYQQVLQAMSIPVVT